MVQTQTTTVLHGLWRTVKFYVLRKTLSKNIRLMVSAGLLRQKFGVPEKTIKNGICLNGKSETRYWRFSKSNDGVYVEYDSIPLKTINRYKLPVNAIKATELLKAELHLKEEIHADLEIRHMYDTLVDAYNTRWPPYLKFYKSKISSNEKQVLYAKSHALIEQIIKYKDAGFSTSLVFEVYTTILNSMLDAVEEPRFYTTNQQYFSKLIREARKGPDKVLLHDSLGVAKPYLVKMTGEIKSYCRLLLRHPKRLLLREIKERVLKKFKVDLSKSTLKTLKKDSFARNILEYDSNGKVWSKQNGLPKLIRFLAEGPGEQYQGDYYKHQFWYRSKTGRVKRLWLYVVLDVFSLKIVGWAASEVASEQLAIDAFKMAFVDHGILPEEIIIDNDPLYKRPAFKRLLSRLNRLGVITTKGAPHTPTWRAEIESTFAVVQRLHSGKKWYIGEGVKSKNIAGNPAPEFVKQLHSKVSLMLSDDEMIVAVEKMIKEYNSSSYSDKKKLSPEVYYKMYSSKRVIQLKDWMVSLMFWKTITKKRIKEDGRIDLQVNNVPYIYQVTEKEAFWKYKNTDIRLCYQPNDLSIVHVFDRLTLDFIGEINPRMILTRDNKEEVLKEHRKIRRNLLDVVKDERAADEQKLLGNHRPPRIDSLDAKILARFNRRVKHENSVAAVKIEPDH